MNDRLLLIFDKNNKKLIKNISRSRGVDLTLREFKFLMCNLKKI